MEISLQIGYDQEFAIANSIPKETHLRPLKSVPEDERKAIWDEAMMFPESKGKGRPKKNVSAETIFGPEEENRTAVFRARFILKHNPELAKLVRDGHPTPARANLRFFW